MEKPLTLFEMVNYDMPKKFTIPFNTINRFTKNWNMPQFCPSKVFENTNMNTIIKPIYVDVSRQRQTEFLQKSGQFDKRKKWLSNSINLKQNQGTPKSTSLLPNPQKRQKKFQTFAIKTKLASSSSQYKMAQKNMHISTPGRHLKILLAKLSTNND